MSGNLFRQIRSLLVIRKCQNCLESRL